MKIGIVGAGHIGETLTRRLRALGHDVAVANSRGPETLADLARETGAHAATLSDTVRGRDLVIVTIPEKSVSRLPKQLFAAAGDAVVVDTGNYYPQRDGRIDAIEDGATESRYVARQIGHPVVKAFNTIHAQHLLEGGKPKGAPGRIALPVAGDDVKAKSTVMRLIDELGFDTVDGGGLDDSWRQQPGTPIYGADLPVGEARRALERAPRERPAGFRAAATPAP
jgi:8-hydroxy-5-deazaflavin:NADPH oxidoreductase